MKKVNEIGLGYLKAWIEKTAAVDECGSLHPVDAKNLDAWADEAEENMLWGNPPTVEMNEIATASGVAETFTIPEDGITTWASES
jgi:hypothetical protein